MRKKKNIISLAGDLAAGKGTVSELLIKDLNYGIYRNGEYARKLAREMNMDITSFNEYLKDHPEIDRQIEKGWYYNFIDHYYIINNLLLNE